MPSWCQRSIGHSGICSFASRDERGEVASKVGGLELSVAGAAYAETCPGELLELMDGVHDVGYVGLQNHAAHNDFVEDVVHLVRVEDQVQLTDILEASIESLYEDLYEVKDAEI